MTSVVLRAVSAVFLVGAVMPAGAAATPGGLTQKAGAAACISDTGRGACADGAGLAGAASVTVSPDGKNAYIASRFRGALAVFDRAADGRLTQKAGNAGCISDTGGGGCVDGRALNRAVSVAVSPDGESAYVASEFSDAVAVFDRAPDGTLTQKPGAAGCVSEAGRGGCTGGVALNAPDSVTVSPDGGSAYVASELGGTVAVLDRAPDGTLTQKPGAAGCVAETDGGCAGGRALFGATSVAVSPDGRSAYVASRFDVAVLDRAPDGTLTQKPGAAGCISEPGRATRGCAEGRALNRASSVAVSPDGMSVYVASEFSGAVAVLDRAPDGALTQKAGRGGCISNRGGGGCVDGAALKRASSVAVSPDGGSAYVASLDGGAVAVFDRSRRPRPIFARPGVNARQRRRRVVVVVTGRLVDTRGNRCVGKVAVGARTGGRRARPVFRIQRSGEGRCTYRTVFKFRVARLRRAVRSRGRRLLVRVNASYKGSHELQGDRAPSVLERVVR